MLRHWKKIILGFLLFLVIGIGAFIVWMHNNAENFIRELVQIQSKGKLDATMKNIDFNFSDDRLLLEEFKLFTVDSTQDPIAHHVAIPNLILKVNSLWDLAWNKELQIDTLYIDQPSIRVHILRTKHNTKKDIPVSESIGNVYKAIQKALLSLEVKRFDFINGSFELYNSAKPDQTPLKITRLQFVVDNLMVRRNPTNPSNKFLNSDSVILRSFDQNILLPDGKHKLAFSRLRLNSGLELIEMDSCTVSTVEQDPEKKHFQMFFDTLKITHLNLLKLYQEDILDADSAYVINPMFKAMMVKKTDQEKYNTTDSISKGKSLSSFTTRLNIRYIGVINSSVQLTNQKEDKRSSIKTEKNNFKLFGLKTGPEFNNGYAFDSIDLSLKNNEFYTTDSVYAIRFKSINIHNDALRLDGLSLSTNPTASARIRRDHHMKHFELQGVDWAELLFEKKIHAKKAVLLEPIIIRKDIASNTKKPAKDLFATIAGLSNQVEIDQIEIRNGTLDIEFKNHSSIALKQADLLLDSRKALQANSYQELAQSIQLLTFRSGTFHTGNQHFQLQNATLGDAAGSLQTEKLQLKAPDQTIDMDDVHISGIHFSIRNKQYAADKLEWSQASIEMKIAPKNPSKKAAGPQLELNELSGKNTKIALHLSKGQEAKAMLSQLNINAIKVLPGNPLHLGLVQLNADKISFGNDQNSIQANAMNYHSEKISSIQGFDFLKLSSTDTIKIKSPEITFQADLAKLLQKNNSLGAIEISQPDVYIRKRKQVQPIPSTEASKKKLPLGDLESLLLKDLTLNAVLFGADKNDSILLQGTASLQKFAHGSNGLLLGKEASFQTEGMQLDQKKIQLRISEKALIKINNISMDPTDLKHQWSGQLQTLQIGHTHLGMIDRKNDSSEIQLKKLVLRSVQLNAHAIKDLSALLRENRNTDLSGLQLYRKTKSGLLSMHNFHYSAADSTAGIDSVSFVPDQTRETFAASFPFQSTYMKGRTGRIELGHIDFRSLLKDSSFKARWIEINEPDLFVYRDKTKPFEGGKIKPLPTTMLKESKAHFYIDSVRIHNGSVTYTERSEKTKDTGTIHLEKLEASISNLGKFDHSSTDSLTIRARFLLMDSLPVYLKVKESYADSLGGFTMTARAGAADLHPLNKFLIPVLSVKLRSGRLDTLSLTAIGREYLSLGKMNFFYHKLNVEFLKNGAQEQKTLLTSLITFAANRFVVKTNNRKRIGQIYFPRNREKAVFNYWTKIALSGLASSVGAKKNKKYLKLYRRALKEKSLPPIHID